MAPNLNIGLKEEYGSLSNDGFQVLAVATKELSWVTDLRKGLR
jgi:hypothetical protein